MERTQTLERQAPERYRDLRDWLEIVEGLGQLKGVEGADWNLELGTLTELAMRQGGAHALLFDKIVGYAEGYRILVGSISNAARLGLTFNFGTGLSDRELVQSLRGKPLRWEQRSPEFPPQEVDSGPVMENFHTGPEVNLWEFPSPLWHEEDGGRYLGTGCAVITRDPDTGVVNLGTYRIMVHDERNAALYISPGKHGRLHLETYMERNQPCPVAVTLGHDPLLFAVGAIEVPLGVCEYNYAGAVKGEAIRVIKGPVTGLPIPANSEVVLEGWIDPQERRPEGPFGEWTGYYASGVRPEPVIRVEAIYHRNNPILLGSPPHKPPWDGSYLRTVVRSALVHDALTKAGIPDVQGVWAPEVGGGRLLLVVSIRQRYAGHARQAGFVASQCREGAYAGRYVIVVDEDIDPSDIQDVLWALLTRSDPVNDIDFIRRAWSTSLDPMIRPGTQGFFNSRAIIDACKPFEWMKEFPKVSVASPELAARVREKWKAVLED